MIGVEEPFLYQMSGFVADQMKEAYPDLVNTRSYVARVIKDGGGAVAPWSVGFHRLEGVIAVYRSRGAVLIPGVEIFKLYDTFGFPLDFTKEIADEKSMSLDMDGFEAELEKQRERARQSWKGDEGRGESRVPEFR